MNSTPPTCSTSPGSGSSGDPGALWHLGWFHPHLHLHQECGREPGAPWCGLCGCHTGGQPTSGMSTISSTHPSIRPSDRPSKHPSVQVTFLPSDLRPSARWPRCMTWSSATPWSSWWPTPSPHSSRSRPRARPGDARSTFTERNLKRHKRASGILVLLGTTLGRCSGWWSCFPRAP